MQWSDITALVPLPGAQPDYATWLEVFPALELAKTTPQSPVYHGEGDVWTHTVWVCNELSASAEYADLTRGEQVTVFLAALLHDISKYSTTVIDPSTGKISQPGHSRKGAIEARVALWDLGVPFAVREHVCRLISVHQQPFWALSGSSVRGRLPEFIVRELSWTCDLRLLALLAEADMRGRAYAEQQTLLDDIELFREFAQEDGCYRAPRAFASDHTRVRYFRDGVGHPDYAQFQEPGSAVTVMCGLPAAGKNTWVARNRPGLPVVSFDDARDELGLRYGKNEGVVAHAAVDKAKDLLRHKAPFVWNATNLSEQVRQKSLGLLAQYGAEIELVYLERPRAELLRRNSKRDTSLTNKALQAMTGRWEVPLPLEAHRVVYEA